MEITTYDTREPGTTKVFFNVHEGAVTSVIVGNHAVATERGFQFYVDDYVADQIDKCELIMNGFPRLKVKEGETVEVPEKSEKQKEIERLEYELERAKNAE